MYYILNINLSYSVYIIYHLNNYKITKSINCLILVVWKEKTLMFTRRNPKEDWFDTVKVNKVFVFVDVMPSQRLRVQNLIVLKY